MLSSAIEIRFANAKDIPNASEFVLIALNDLGMQNECVEILGNEFTNRLETYGPQNTLLAFDNSNNNSIIGFIEIDPQKSVQNTSYFISNLYVLPSYRKRGIASMLVHKMSEDKCSNGAELIVQVCNEDDRKFWEKLNFSVKNTILSLKLN